MHELSYMFWDALYKMNLISAHVVKKHFFLSNISIQFPLNSHEKLDSMIF